LRIITKINQEIEKDEEEKERKQFTAELRISLLHNEKPKVKGVSPENTNLLSPRSPLKASRKIDGTNMPTIIV